MDNNERPRKEIGSELDEDAEVDLWSHERSLCLSDETLKAVGPFYLVSMPGEVKDPTQGV